MADNSSLPVASGNETFANDDIGGVKYPRPKMGWGPDGTYNDTDVASGKPFPVQLRGSDGTDRSNSLPVVATNAGTFAVQPAGSVAHDAVGTGVNPVLAGGYASAAAPTDVSADGDSVRAWMLRNGAQATVVTAAGALIGGDATNGLDVDVTRLIPGVTATALGKAEDAAHASGDVGVMALAVRRDTAASGAADGDYVTLNTDDLGNLRVHIDDRQLDGSEYETVAASQTTQTLGATGGTGDYLREILVIPATTSPGNIQIKDGSNSAITVFTGGTDSVSNLVPFTISLGLTSTSGAWQLTTGANVSAVGIGNFS